MSLQITLDIFSGRPNPVIVLDGADADGLLKRLQPTSKRIAGGAAPSGGSILGYRGLLIEQVGPAPSADLPARFQFIDGQVFASGASWRVADPDIEEYLLTSVVANNPMLPPDLLGTLREEMKLRGAAKSFATAAPSDALASAPVKCACAPLYEPDLWNDGAQKQLRNNCYNYACNYRTDTFAQPGRASGNPITERASCAGVKPCALSDDLNEDPRLPSKGIKCPDGGILVALVIWPRWDYHWYRLGRNGFWSHKPGTWAVTNLDNAGNPITDPRRADRGRYNDFCGFMIARYGHVKIS